MCVLLTKKGKIHKFFSKKSKKSLVIQKKVVPLHSHSEEILVLSNRKNCGNSSVGRAQPCQGWGQVPESRFPLIFLETTSSFILVR